MGKLLPSFIFKASIVTQDLLNYDNIQTLNVFGVVFRIKIKYKILIDNVVVGIKVTQDV